MLKKYHIPIPGAAIVLLAFFLPWISVSCMGVTIDASGLDLARGVPDLELAGDFVYWLFPVVAIISLIIALVTMRDESTESNTAVGHIILGLAGLGLLLTQWLRIRSNMQEAQGELDFFAQELLGSVVDVEWGVWLTVAGLLVMIVGGVLSFLSARDAVSGDYEYNGDTGGTYISEAIDPPSTQDAIGESMDMRTPGLTAEYTPEQFPDPFVQPASSPKTEVLNRQPPALAWLVVSEGNRAGHDFRLSENTSIGRDPSNDIVLDDSSLSGQHARIKMEEDKVFFLYDLASTNGVFVYPKTGSDWERVYRYELREGDKVKMGRTVMHFMSINEGTAGSENSAA